MIDCLETFGTLVEPRLRTRGDGGPLDARVEVRSTGKLAQALAHGFGLHAAADAIVAACTRALASCIFPREAAVEIHLPEGTAAELEALVLGVTRACTGQGLALARLTSHPAAELSITVQVRGSRVRAPVPPHGGDALVALAANGLHEQGHRGALDAARRSGGPSATDLRRIFAFQKSYLGVLRTPLLEGWYRCGLAVEQAGLVAGLESMLAPAFSAQLTDRPWPEVAEHAWMLEPVELALNLGVGVVLVVQPANVDHLVEHISMWGEPVWTIGRVVEGD